MVVWRSTRRRPLDRQQGFFSFECYIGILGAVSQVISIKAGITRVISVLSCRYVEYASIVNSAGKFPDTSLNGVTLVGNGAFLGALIALDPLNGSRLAPASSSSRFASQNRGASLHIKSADVKQTYTHLLTSLYLRYTKQTITAIQ